MDLDKITKIRAEDRERRRNKIVSDYEIALQKVRKIIPNDIGDYTIGDAVRYVRSQYAAKEIPFARCFDYIAGVNALKNVPKPICSLTDGNVPDEACAGIFLLPALCRRAGKLIGKEDGMLLILGYENDKLESWWCGGNRLGYRGLAMELNVLAGKTKKDLLNAAKL